MPREVFLVEIVRLRLWNIHEESCVDVVRLHRAVQWSQDIPRMIEAVAGEEHALARPFE